MRAKCHADCASHYPATGFISPNTVTTNNPYKAADENRHHFLTLVGTLSEERQVRVATYRNATQRTTRCTIGHVWQHRFYSCVQEMPIGKPLSVTLS